MSEENLAIVKRAIDAINRRDADGLAEFVTLDCEWFPALLKEVEGMAFQGREGLDAYLAAIADTWEEFLYGEAVVIVLSASSLAQRPQRHRRPYIWTARMALDVIVVVRRRGHDLSQHLL